LQNTDLNIIFSRWAEKNSCLWNLSPETIWRSNYSLHDAIVRTCYETYLTSQVRQCRRCGVREEGVIMSWNLFFLL